MKTNFHNINLNLNVRGLPQSATLKINEISNEIRKSGRNVFRLGLGQSPFPVPQPVVEELKVNAHQKDYLPVMGLYQLREAVAEYHRRMQGVGCSAEEVIIGPGSKELMFLLQYVYYGDLVIPTPSWVSYAPQAHIIGRQVRWIKTHRENKWRLSAEELERHCHLDYDKPRIVILNYPSNPVGATYSETELIEIAEIARKHKVILCSDEIYGELHHKGNHISIAKFYPEGTIISGGLSKWCGAGGWRLGTFTFPKSLSWLQHAISVMASETFTSTMGNPAIIPFSMASWIPLSTAGIYWRGMTPPTILSTNSYCSPRGNGSISIQVSANCPRPPLCFLCLPWTRALPRRP